MTMIIDCHAHLGGEYNNLPSILATLDRSGADKVILCPSESPRKNSMWIPHLAGRIGGRDLNFLVNRIIRVSTPFQKVQKNIDRQNEDVFRITAGSEGRVVQFFWANPLKEGILEEMEEKYGLWKFKGIKLHQSSHPFRIKSYPFAEIAHFASHQHLPVFIHLHSKKEIRDFISVSRRYKTWFIVGHLIGLELFIRNRKDLGENILFDISCPPLVTVNRVRLALETFGPGRIVMGTDTPFGRNNLSVAISRIRSLGLPARETGMILGDNMRGILGIGK